MDSTGTLWLPPGHSTFASDVDFLFYVIAYLSLAFFVIVTVGSLYLAFRYRNKGKRELTSGIAHNVPLEVTWTLIPTILVFVIFVWGFKDYLKMHVSPKNAIEVKVSGQKWCWSFEYPGGVTEVNTLTVPVGKPVSLLMSSQDVIHSFFVPAFRTKMDVLPNRYTRLWFEATAEGEYDIYCTEYCGKGHSEMLGKVLVLKEQDYNNWLSEAAAASSSLSLEEYGEQLYRTKACITCHSVDGTANQGPTWKGIFGKTEKLADGSDVTIDENYIRESILNPMAKITAGYQPIMPTFQGILNDRDIDALIAYIKTLE